MATYLPYEQLVNGSYFAAINLSYDIPLGGHGIVYVFYYFMVLVCLALVTKSSANMAIGALLGAIIFLPLMPANSQELFYFMALLAITFVIYKFFTNKG